MTRLSEIFDAANQIIGYFRQAGITPRKSAIVFFEESKIQYRYSFRFIAPSTKTGETVDKLRAKFARKLTFGQVEGITVLAMPSMQDLREYVIEDKDGTTVDLPRVLSTIAADDIMIQFEKRMSTDQRDMLIPIVHAFRNPFYRQDRWHVQYR